METKYKKEMLIESPSGFAMPFTLSEAEGTAVQCTLFYGEQMHPHTGEKFFHNGWDLMANHIPLQALASGLVVAFGNDNTHDNYIIIRYGKYDVKYGHLSQAFVNYGEPVVAGQDVAVSGPFLHLGVRFEGEEVDPKELITMLFVNIQQLDLLGIPHTLQPPVQSAVRTPYDKEMEEIVQLMTHYLPAYLQDMLQGQYAPPQRTEQTLRNIFVQSADKHYFFESSPNIANPLGLSSRANPMVSKLQTLLIEDFLNYLALNKGHYLSTWNDDQKKKFLTKQREKA